MNSKVRLLYMVILLVIVQTAAFAQYNVGSDDGFSLSCYIQANPYESPIYSVGSDDGFSSGSYAQSDNPYSSIYSVGSDDGFSSFSYVQANNPYLSIYSVGIGDGFSRICYSQSDNPYASIYSVGNGDGFSLICVGSVNNEVPLPIELLSFKARELQNTVLLSWTTATETNNDYFTIERSDDANTFETLAVVAGVGNSSIKNSYEMIDNYPMNGPNYYRLKQTDYDGKFSYSQILYIDIRNSIGLKLSPNPTDGIVRVDGSIEDLKNIQILNMLGQDVSIQVSFSNTNSKTVVIDMSKLPRGMYFIRTKTQVGRIIKNTSQ